MRGFTAPSLATLRNVWGRRFDLKVLFPQRYENCQYEWWSHERIGRNAGLDQGVMESIKKGEPPKFKEPIESIVYEFTCELIETQDVSDNLYYQALKILGEIAVVELVVLIGYYTMVSMSLNVFRVPVPPGEEPPFHSSDDSK